MTVEKELLVVYVDDNSCAMSVSMKQCDEDFSVRFFLLSCLMGCCGVM